VRFTASGLPDASFGVNGRVGQDLAAKAGTYTSVLVQGDGKILAAGTTVSLGGGGDDMIVSRFNSDASPDTSFGAGGHALIDFTGL